MNSTPFKVILVGGGPVGLTAAHALSRANIDFVMLESRPSVVVEAGSNLVLQPMALRTLYQLGLGDALDKVSSPLGRIDRFSHSGADMGDMQWFEFQRENFGAYPRVISREDLTRVLYASLPIDIQAKMLPSKKVIDINTTSDGVKVDCADGTVYHGSIVIGADGAHSLVRERMRTLALASGSSDVNDENPFLTTYRALWLRFPTALAHGLQAGTTCEAHGSGVATQLFAGEETAVVGVYERLEKPTRDRVRFTQADQDDLVKRWGHLPLLRNKQLSLGQAYAGKIQSGLVNLEEGVVKHWSWGGRIVLAGDAAHKFTPSTGAGCNNGIVDVVMLSNELYKTFQAGQNASMSLPATPSKEAMALAFGAYQDLRYKNVVAHCKGASVATALATWENTALKLFNCYLLSSHMLQRYLSNRANAAVAQTPPFNFVEGEERIAGKVKWTSPIPSKVY